MTVRWSHCVLKVRDLDTMVEFYCDLFGWRLVDRGKLGEDTEIAFLSGSSSDHHQMGLMTGRGEGDSGSLDHNAFRVDSVADVQATVEWIEADERIGSGFPVTHGNAVSVYFADPEGNGIEVFADTPWHVQQPQARGWNPAKSADEVLESVETRFASEPGFSPMEEYRAAQATVFNE